MKNSSNAVVDELFGRHRHRLLAFFRRRVRQSADAPDLAQEVYVRMLGVRDMEAIRNPELYLYTVANNLVKEHATVESRWLGRDAIEEQAVQSQMAELPRFDGDIDSARRVARLREVMRELSPKCRATVLLQYHHGLTYQEIGVRLGVSANMVKKYLTHALRHCRRRMARLK